MSMIDEQIYKDVFGAIDTNKDGSIDKAEFENTGDGYAPLATADLD